jgi:hypothetical protein
MAGATKAQIAAFALGSFAVLAFAIECMHVPWGESLIIWSASVSLGMMVEHMRH